LRGKASISTRIALLSAILAIAFCGFFLVLMRLAGQSASWSLVFLLLFGAFILSLIAFYYFYFIDLSRRLNDLSEKIRRRLASNELPRNYNALDEDDGLSRLKERVDFLIGMREKELSHFENLDSYRKEYLGNVSHELKTPVFNIQGYIDTLLNGGLEDPAVNYEFLRKAEKSIDRLIAIIDDLETITQLESGSLNLDLDAFDIAALVRDVFAGVEQFASKKNITLELDKKYDRPVMVIADKYRIRQVLANLVSNSIKYGKEGGSTMLSFRYLNDDLLVTITDNGHGIDEKHLPRIFERFYRVDKGRSREQGGTGLGLAIVKHIIEAHNKSIEVESKAGKGTKFTFSLNAVP
jgi:two-component system, OmpR family, phosphate regulon sensor histidine kinase PhoR